MPGNNVFDNGDSLRPLPVDGNLAQAINAQDEGADCNVSLSKEYELMIDTSLRQHKTLKWEQQG